MAHAAMLSAVVAVCLPPEVLSPVVEIPPEPYGLNALSGGFHVPLDVQFELADLNAEALIPARVTDRQVANSIRKTCSHLASLSTTAARERQAAKIKAIGIPLPFTSVEVDKITPIAWPYYVGLMRRGSGERLVAVDAVRERVSEYMTLVLTKHHSFVLDALGHR